MLKKLWNNKKKDSKQDSATKFSSFNEAPGHSELFERVELSSF